MREYDKAQLAGGNDEKGVVYALLALGQEVRSLRRHLEDTAGVARPRVHLILAIGQSNMSGRGTPYGPTTDPEHPRIWQLGADETVIKAAEEPLEHRDHVDLGIGPSFPFCRLLAQDIGPDDQIVIIPAAHGGTQLSSNSTNAWRFGTVGGLTERALAQTADAITLAQAKWTDHTVGLTAVLWAQGEADRGGSISGATYKADYDALIAGIRETYPDVPFITSGLVPEGLYKNTSIDIHNVHLTTPRTTPNTGFTGGVVGHSADETHYDAAGQRLIAQGLKAEYDRIIAGNPKSLDINDTFPYDGPLLIVPEGNAWVRHASTTNFGTLNVSSGALTTVVSGSASPTVYAVDTGSADGTINVNGLLANKEFRLVFRFQDYQNYYALYINQPTNTDLKLIRYNNGSIASNSTITSTTPTVAADFTIEMSGTSVIFRIDGTQVGTITDNALNTATSHGMFTKPGGTNIQQNVMNSWSFTV